MVSVWICVIDAQCPVPTKRITDEETEGPYWIDEMLHRSDIREDRIGIPLTLHLTIYTVYSHSTRNAACAQTYAPVTNAQIDIWHCDANGTYGDEASQGTVGQRWLRGYQRTNVYGEVTFLTIYPGWYSGRTAHIHFRVRLQNDMGVYTYSDTSQLYFDDNITSIVYESPIYSRGQKDAPNTRDSLFDTTLIMPLSGNNTNGYEGYFNVYYPFWTGTFPETTPEVTPSYGWNISNWSPCTLLCGGGTQIRTVECISSTGDIVDNSLCDDATKVPSLRTCNEVPCFGVSTYMWQTGNWSACSNETCVETRMVACTNGTHIVSDAYCSGSFKPLSYDICNYNASRCNITLISELYGSSAYTITYMMTIWIVIVHVIAMWMG